MQRRKRVQTVAALAATLALLTATVVLACPQRYCLCAGQHTTVGFIEVWSGSKYLYVTYQITEPGWEIMETHLAAGGSRDDLPQTKKGNARPGQFPYSGYHDGVTEYTYQIPLDEIGITPGDDIYIAAHAVVWGRVMGTETAWGGCCETGLFFRPGKGGGWAKYIIYESEAF